ncbi:hypothetical protein MOQ_003641 [Trypanosoma cruzi marinkellei]|uniref:Uncharacterized protein n=1 Tax=Trypanosoma cruzi marinkellei TaxID=85056 RepID=K2MBH4_TRYCR|nr:hypothetical protein MOQ_003641 [Trypanosoma cruzi marinkellei]
MSLRLSIHAHSVSPVSINFDALEAYVAGLSVEEALQYILNTAVTWPTGDDEKESQKQPGNIFLDCPVPVGVECWQKLQVETPQPLSLPDVGRLLPPQMEMTTDTASAKHGDEEGEKNANEPGAGNHGTEPAADSRSRSAFFDSSSCTFQREFQQALSDMVRGERSILRQELVEQFVLFDMFRENYLATPYVFLSRYSIPMTLKDRRRMVEVFYSVDEKVLKMFFGDRMHKLELEEESESWFSFGARAIRSQNIQKLIEAGITEGSLKRQWENLKRVCNFLLSAYRGRDGMLIPYTTPVLTALQQCFALRGTLGVQYGTFVFGFEHRLRGRFWSPLSYAECITACQALSLWCDGSQLNIREDFSAGCARIARFLDEYRVVAEMHQLIFGEAMRSRWQVQFDEVQRAITINTGGGTSGNPHGTTAAGTTMLSPTTNVSHALLPRNTSTGKLDGDAQSGFSAASAVTPRTLRPQPSSVANRPSNTPPHANTGLSGTNINSSPVAAPINVAASSTVSSGNANTSGSTQVGSAGGGGQAAAPNRLRFSANGAFTRAFLQEFPSIMRCLFRMATTISKSGEIEEALELFYGRVYMQLSNLGYRLQNTQGVEISTLSQELPSPEVEGFSELAESKNMCGSQRGCRGERRATTNTTTAEFAGDEVGSTGNPAKANPSECEEKLEVMANALKNTVVNTSLVGHAIALSSRRPCTQASQHQSQPAAHIFSNHSSVAVDSLICLRELCMLLSMMPNAFNSLTTITEEDHAACDNEFANFVLALKVLVQIHMASDDL